MQYLIYGLSSVLTSDAAATAVLHYTAALAQNSLSDVIQLPAVDLTGTRTLVSMVLGPGIPVMTENAGDDVLEPIDQDFTNELATRTRTVLTGGHSST